ncbi:RAM signaling pathway SOG2 [Fusarium subglutinans]|uniref:RAM signaling pathway SOG2 n=1 Tax=Gibberella subglutinans TaxID=42677 RepID=A0A8H5QAJ7_GIBSU|nr:RAM signaling pathway SOG2 [Fusarium subglutinans]KAF5611925.1 RAM signaling pathway SOG2 [Fusarium subglutinans]
MASLKVLAVQKNKIQRLPFCISEMTVLLALKIDGNPLTPMLSRIVEAQSLGAASKSARDNENNDMAVTAQIKQVLKHEARSTASRSVSQTALGSNQQFEPRQHSSKRSRAGRFPVKVDGADLPTSRPSLLSPKSHSKAPSMHSKALWSPSTSYQKQDEGEHSSNNPDGLQTPDPQNVRACKDPSVTHVNKRFGLQQIPQLPSTDRLSQHLRGLSLNTAIYPRVQSQEPKDYSSPSTGELLNIVPISRSNTRDPLLEMARTVFFSIHRIHWLIEVLSDLTSDGGSKRSSLQMVAYNARLHLGELGEQIQTHVAQAGDISKMKQSMSQIRRACGVLTKAYLPICSQVCRNIEVLVERAEGRFVSDLIYSLYASIMGLRAEFLCFQKQATLQLNTEPGSATGQPQENSNGKSSLSIPTTHTRRSSNEDAAPQGNPWTPPPPARTLTLDGEPEVLHQLYLALRRLCKLIPENLPSTGRKFQTQIQDVKRQQSALDACSRVLRLSEAIKQSLAPVHMKLSAPLRNLYYQLVDAWATFGGIVKSLNSQLGLEPDSRKRLQQIQQLVKEVMQCLRVLPINTNANTAFNDSLPLTPQQASLGPAVQATISLSP